MAAAEEIGALMKGDEELKIIGAELLIGDAFEEDTVGIEVNDGGDDAGECEDKCEVF